MGNLLRGIVGVALLMLVACAPHASSPAGVLNIYNWADYIDPSLLKQFTAETGIKVRYDTFDSSEVLETKLLQGGSGYDIVGPSNTNLHRLITAKAVQPLDKSQLKGLDALDPATMARLASVDPGAQYAVPYMRGNIGIAYNIEAVSKRLPGLKIDSWSVVFDPAVTAKLKDCGVYFLDASDDMLGLALNAMGRDPNSRDPKDYAAAAAQLLKVRPYVRKFHSSEDIAALANGDICVAIAYSGDALQARNRAREAGKGVKIAFALPREGSQVYYDVLAIPADAPNPRAAHAFLNFMLRPDIIAKASNFTRYPNANAAASGLVDPALRSDPAAYPPAELDRRLYLGTDKDQTLLREVNRLWTKVVTGQ